MSAATAAPGWRRAARVAGLACVLLALGGVGLGIWLIHAGSNPEPGGGSLGHVGMVIAGIIYLIAALLLGLLAWALRRWGRRGASPRA